MVIHPRAGVLSSFWGVWRVEKLTIPPIVSPAIGEQPGLETYTAPAGPRAPAAGLRATRYIRLLDKKRLLEQARRLEQAS